MKANKLRCRLIGMVVAMLMLSACGAEQNDATTAPPPSGEALETTTPVETSAPRCGNTSGNISNGGFAAQDGDAVYYVLPAPSKFEMQMGTLVREEPDGSGRTVLYEGLMPRCLNVVDGWIYWIDILDDRIYKMSTDGTYTRFSAELPGSLESIVVADGQIYCRGIDSRSLPVFFRLGTDGGEAELLTGPELPLSSGFAVYDGWIWYSESDGSGSWTASRLRMDGSEKEGLAAHQLYCINIVDDRLCYLNEELEICSMDPDSGESRSITPGVTAVTFCAAEDWLYYTNCSAIYRIRPDGTEQTKLCDFPSSHLIRMNLAGDQLYLMDADQSLHRIKTTGGEPELIQ